MTAHVAERGEGRGRVVLRLTGTEAPSDRAIAAAIRIAVAFHAEIESLFVADRQLFDAARYDFAREIAAASPAAPHIAPDALGRHFELIARAIQRRIMDMAARAEVPVHARFVRSTPLRALAEACQASGPWNVVALAEPFTVDLLARLEQVFERVTGMTGVLLVGPRAKRSSGPVVAVIEDLERLTGMVRTAQRIARAAGEDVVLAVAAPTRALQALIEREVRHASADMPGLSIVALGRPGGGTAVAAEALRRLEPGFVIAEHGGILVPRKADHRWLAAAIECPLLVVR